MSRSDDLLYALTQAARQVEKDLDLKDGPGATTDYRKVAIRQAVEMETRRLINVELMRERDEALGVRDHALDLAAQYARQAGIEHPDRDAALQYAEQWRERLDGWGRTAQEQESRRMGNLGLSMQLQELCAGKRAFSGTAAELAKVVAETLNDLNNAQHGPKRIRDLFVTPDVPQADERQGVA